jgi:hypothetical protein
MICYKTSSKFPLSTTFAAGSSAAAGNARGNQESARCASGAPVSFFTAGNASQIKMHYQGRRVRACRPSVLPFGTMPAKLSPTLRAASARTEHCEAFSFCTAARRSNKAGFVIRIVQPDGLDPLVLEKTRCRAS